MRATLDDSFLRLERAEQNLKQLKRQLTAYKKANERTSLIKVEGLTVSAIWPPNPPQMLAVRAGEIADGCRSALDYLVYQLAILASGEINKSTQFPIEDAPEKFEARTRLTKKGRPNFLTGISAPHIAAIEAVQPYNGGDWLEFLQAFSNEEKHRLVPLLSYQGTTRRINAGGTEAEAKALGGFRMPGDDVSMYYPAPVDVTFPGGAPVKETLEKIVSETRQLLEAFDPDFKRVVWGSG